MSRSVCRSRQVPSHTDWPIGQVVTQTPLKQSCPVGHAVPQAPQLRWSAWRSAQ
ncbi:MAG: hypothetical protein R3A52_05375 [Polyangiales bacterium]